MIYYIFIEKLIYVDVKKVDNSSQSQVQVLNLAIPFMLNTMQF